MARPLALAPILLLLLAGCTGAEVEEDFEEDFTEEAGEDGGEDSGTPLVEDEPAAQPERVTPTPTPTIETPAEEETPEDGDLDETPEQEASADSLAEAPPAQTVERTPSKPAPLRDSDRDGIPDTLEQALASDCKIAGRACSELGIEAPKIGTRDLILVQVGRSGHEQNWRLSAPVWDSVRLELANHSIHLQVADVGIRDDVDRKAAWTDPANAGRYFVHWVLYNDPATAATSDTSGTQLYDLIELAERGSQTEERATILHEVYHALLGNLHANRSTCANEEIGGPGHSSDPASVLYTSPDCETNEGNVFRLSRAESEQLRDEPFAALAEMNGEGWAVEG